MGKLNKLWSDYLEYKDIKIYPFLMEDYDLFEDIISVLLFNKNQIPDPEIIKMSYLRFLFGILPYITDENGNKLYTDINKKIDDLFRYIFKDNAVFVTYEDKKVVLNATESIDIKLDKIKTLISNLKGVRVLNEIFFNLESDDYKNINTLYNKITNLTYELLNQYNANSIEYKTLYSFWNGVVKIIDDKVIKIKDKDFDKIRKIILAQNAIPTINNKLHPDLQKELEENMKYLAQKQGYEEGSIEEQILAYKCKMRFETYEPIKKMTIYQFRKELARLDLITDYQIYKTAESSGMVTFKKPIPHWRSHISDEPDYSSLLMNKQEFDVKMNQIAKGK